MSVLALGLKLSESMDVNISNSKSFHRSYKRDPQNNHFSFIPSSLKSCFLRRISGGSLFFLGCRWLYTSILFESFPKEKLQIMNPKNPVLFIL